MLTGCSAPPSDIRDRIKNDALLLAGVVCGDDPRDGI
jgi:hypothetical protein